VRRENLCGQGDTIWFAPLPLRFFSAVADLIAWALHVAGIDHLIHYLDDFCSWWPRIWSRVNGFWHWCLRSSHFWEFQ
jgi:hypothetical protein